MQVIQFIVLLVLSIHFHGTCQATKIPTTQSIADQTTQSTTVKEFPLERATRITSDRNKGKRYNNNSSCVYKTTRCKWWNFNLTNEKHDDVIILILGSVINS